MTHHGTHLCTLPVALAAIALTACSSAHVGADAGDDDAARPDAGAPDASTTPDSGDSAMPADAGFADVGAPADAEVIIDSGLCRYLDLEIWITDCAAGYTYIHHWQRLDGPPASCPEYYTVGTDRYDSLEDIGNALTCDLDCLRAPATSVSLIHCGHRSGFIQYQDPDGDCPGLFETPDGLFTSVEEWEAAVPCP